MNILKYRATALVLSCAALLNACGGGGGGGDPLYGGGDTPTTPTSPSTTPSSLLLNLSQSSVQNSTNTPITATVTAVNSSGQTLKNVPVQFAVTGGLYSVTGSVTGDDGKLAASVDVTNEKANRVVTVTASSGSVTVTKNILVTGVKISGTPNPSLIVPGNSGTIEFTVQDANSDAISTIPVTVNSPFDAVTGATNVVGKYTYSYSVPSSYGSSEFVATITAGGVSYSQTVAVQQGGGGGTVPNAASVSTARVEINPAVVGTNAGGSATQSATIRFKAFGATSLPLQNVRVSFDLAGDPSAIGGVLTSGSGVVYTDSNGIATTTYIPGPTATSTAGLTIRACYSSANFTPSSSGNAASGTSACPASASEQIVINNEALNVTIGPDDKITETPDGLRYLVKYVVQVVNASGQAKENVTITPTLDIVGFQKGLWDKAPTDSEWTRIVTSTGDYQDRDISSIVYDGCRNEDLNRNGINDPGEDLDADNVLEPRKSDAAISFVETGVTRTDATGGVALQVSYLKNVASWARIKIYVRGAVSGTEGVGTFVTELPVPASARTSEETPAFASNPYGAAASCSAH
jgi:hypothetical protein